MPVLRFLRRRFQDLMMFVEGLLRLILYFEQQNEVRISEQRAVEHDGQEGKFWQEPISKLRGRAVLFLSD